MMLTEYYKIYNRQCMYQFPFKENEGCICVVVVIGVELSPVTK